MSQAISLKAEINMVKSNSILIWTVRVVLAMVFFGILMLNIKVLSKNSQSDDIIESTTNDQLLLSQKADGRRTLKQPLISADENPNASETKKPAASDNKITKLGLPMSQPRNCRQPHCKEYLLKSELLAMSKCSAETAQRTVNGKLKGQHESDLKENSCSFMNGSNRLPVALASTSGSGNTWIRGLLERATGICTGFLYCDYAMRREGFIGETVKSGNALVVKTHTISPKWYGTKQPRSDDPYYGSAIYILRNPYMSMIAEWNRRVTYDMLRLPHNESHTNEVQEHFWRKLNSAQLLLHISMHTSVICHYIYMHNCAHNL